jgi:hypothetical protein
MSMCCKRDFHSDYISNPTSKEVVRICHYGNFGTVHTGVHYRITL